MKSKLYGAKAVFIDPKECGSLLGYKISNQGQWFDANVTLSDCCRMIDWSFNETPQAVAKLDNAINFLRDFRTALVKAQINYNRELAKEKAAEKAKGKTSG